MRQSDIENHALILSKAMLHYNHSTNIVYPYSGFIQKYDYDKTLCLAIFICIWFIFWYIMYKH